MSDINHRLAELEKVAKANEPSDYYKDLYPLAPLEFTKLQKQGESNEVLTKIWHKVVDDYEQAHQDELRTYLKDNTLPPWRRLVDLSGRKRNGDTIQEQEPNNLTAELTERALQLYRQYKSDILITRKG